MGGMSLLRLLPDIHEAKLMISTKHEAGVGDLQGIRLRSHEQALISSLAKTNGSTTGALHIVSFLVSRSKRPHTLEGKTNIVMDGDLRNNE